MFIGGNFETPKQYLKRLETAFETFVVTHCVSLVLYAVFYKIKKSYFPQVPVFSIEQDIRITYVLFHAMGAFFHDSVYRWYGTSPLNYYISV